MGCGRPSFPPEDGLGNVPRFCSSAECNVLLAALTLLALSIFNGVEKKCAKLNKLNSKFNTLRQKGMYVCFTAVMQISLKSIFL